MKEIMADYSTQKDQGVPSFDYNPADERYPLLFELTRPLDELGEGILKDFAGKSLSMVEVYRKHHVGKRYIKKNYKKILSQLEAEGKITADPPASNRRISKGRRTFADYVRITFPPVAE